MHTFVFAFLYAMLIMRFILNESLLYCSMLFDFRPLSEGKVLKMKFDEIFAATR